MYNLVVRITTIYMQSPLFVILFLYPSLLANTIGRPSKNYFVGEVFPLAFQMDHIWVVARRSMHRVVAITLAGGQWENELWWHNNNSILQIGVIWLY